MTDQTKPDPVLPPLPAPATADPGRFGAMWAGDQMQAYGHACYTQARADLIAELRPVAWMLKDAGTPSIVSNAEKQAASATFGRYSTPLAIIPEN